MTERRPVPGKRVAAAVIVVIMAAIGFAAPAAAQDASHASAILNELNDSGISGTAELTARGQQTDVAIRANGALGDHPTHIHQGDCSDLDPNPEYPLNDVELQTTDLTGSSDTTIDVPLRELLASPHLILIHESANMIGAYVACGDIVAGALATPAPAAESPAAGPLGDTGTGTAAVANGGGWPLALAALALGCGCVGLALRRRAPRS